MPRLNNGSFGCQKMGRGSGRKLGKCGNGNRFRGFLGMQSASEQPQVAQGRERGRCRGFGWRFWAGQPGDSLAHGGRQGQASVDWINSAIDDLQQQINDLRQKLGK